MALIRPRFTQVTPHFTSVELVCRHCGGIPSRAAMLKLAQFGETIRAELGDRVMHVTSAYRCPVHNENVGGAPDSYHKQAMALDFVIRGLSVDSTWHRCKALQARGIVGGLGRYDTWTHADFGPQRDWDGP